MTEKQAVEVQAATLCGLEARPVRLSVHPTAGGGLSFAGWKGASEREIRARVQSAIQALSASLGQLSALRVHIDRDDYSGAELDLCAAVALVAHAGGLDPAKLEGVWLAAELGLDGKLKPVRGVVSIAETAKALGARLLIVAAPNRVEAEQVGGIRVETPEFLEEVIRLLSFDLSGFLVPSAGREGFAEAREALKAARSAVDGGTRFLRLVGSPGGGKMTQARELAARLPVLVESERREVARIYSVAGLAQEGQGWARRPFRAPHHSCSVAGLVGGGVHVRPGEISLAHRGTLLLDEAQEFSRLAIDELGCALKAGEAVISARGHRVSMPAVPRLVILTTNPCPCGWYGTSDAVPGSSRECRCTPEAIGRYRDRSLGRLGELLELTVRLP